MGLFYYENKLFTDFFIENNVSKVWYIYWFNRLRIIIIISPKPHPSWSVLHITHIMTIWSPCSANTALKFYDGHWFILANSISCVPNNIYITKLLILLMIYLMLITSVDLTWLFTSWYPSRVSIPLVRMMIKNLASFEQVSVVRLTFSENALHPSWQ